MAIIALNVAHQNARKARLHDGGFQPCYAILVNHIKKCIPKNCRSPGPSECSEQCQTRCIFYIQYNPRTIAKQIMEKLCSPLDGDCFVFVKIDTPKLRVRTFQNRKPFLRSERPQTTADVTRKLLTTHQGLLKTKPKGIGRCLKPLNNRQAPTLPGKTFFPNWCLRSHPKHFTNEIPLTQFCEKMLKQF